MQIFEAGRRRSTFLLATLAAAALSQTALSQTGGGGRPEPIVSPEIGSDNRVTFRIRAPKASEVLVSASVGTLNPKPAGAVKDQPGMWNMPMHKDEKGLWTLTIGPLEPDAYRYALLIDGVRAIDQANPNVRPGGTILWSYFDVPGNPPRFDELQDVPHGSVQYRTYRARESKIVRNVAIYVPPDYDRNPNQRFPVLYLLHGGGDSEEGWVRLGHAPEIEENLLAQHRTVPMLIVMPYGDTPGDATTFESIEAFGRELFGDVFPLVEKNYRVVANRDNRAIVGFSMGGGQSFTLGLRNRDKFAWVGEFSAGAFGMKGFDLEKQVPGFLKDPAALNQQMKLLYLGCGTEDTRYPAHTQMNELLTKDGIHHEFHDTPGEHEWRAWRHLLADFMPKLFRGTP
jgi:enterochelin esterase-like enzyme